MIRKKMERNDDSKKSHYALDLNRLVFSHFFHWRIPNFHDKAIRSIGSVSRQRHGANAPSAPLCESAVQDRRSRSRGGFDRDRGAAGGSQSEGRSVAASGAGGGAAQAAARVMVVLPRPALAG